MLPYNGLWPRAEQISRFIPYQRTDRVDRSQSKPNQSGKILHSKFGTTLKPKSSLRGRNICPDTFNARTNPATSFNELGILFMAEKLIKVCSALKTGFAL